ncbi:MAG: cation diffusion facilitator family transporter [Pseudomonadota bacterium]
MFMPNDAATPGQLPLERTAQITRTTALLSVAVASLLFVLKAGAWYFSGSVAMLSSMADSALDGAASLFTLLAVGYATTPPDDAHRFGHGKAEALAALLQALLVGAAAALVAREAIAQILDPQPLQQAPLAIAVMIISIALTIGLISAQTWAVRRTGSVATAGDRAHYFSDLGANLAVIGGIAAAGLFGVAWADPVIGLLVAAWLAWTAIDVARGGINQLLDHELDDDARAKIEGAVLSSGKVLGVHGLRTRASGPYIHIQFHADLPPDLSLIEAHERMVEAEARILDIFPAADVLIHPDPRGAAIEHGSAAFKA